MNLISPLTAATPASLEGNSGRVLLISYAFPPVGGAGVQRATKFVKYLRHFGWKASVLTVENPSVPVLDGSLGVDVPADTVVRRARTWEPSYSLKNRVAAGRDPSDSKGRTVGLVGKAIA